MRFLSGVMLVIGIVLLAASCGDSSPPSDAAAVNPLYAPGRLHAEAPDSFRVRLETTEGDVLIRVVRAWAPRGADRFWTLVSNGFYDDTRVYRVVEGFMAQFGVAADGRVNSAWRDEKIEDDSLVVSNARGRIAFAKSGQNDRTTEVFISYRDNAGLDAQGFVPFGEVIEGMEVVDAWYAGYGDGPPRGEGPYAIQALSQGNVYLDSIFPDLTRIERAVVVR